MKLTISKIDKILWSGEAESVSVPATDGAMTILPHHMPIITTLKAGVIVVKSANAEPISFTIEKGFLEVGKSETVILV